MIALGLTNHTNASVTTPARNAPPTKAFHADVLAESPIPPPRQGTPDCRGVRIRRAGRFSGREHRELAVDLATKSICASVRVTAATRDHTRQEPRLPLSPTAKLSLS